MPWCPNCKLEYIAGKTICPDCNVPLVDELSDEEEESNVIDFKTGLPKEEEEDAFSEEETSEEEGVIDANSVVIEMIRTLKEKGVTEEQIEEILENMKDRAEQSRVEYKPVADRYNENKSGAAVLIGCGAVGLVFIILVMVGVISLPLSGFSFWLSTGVMGLLFLIFLICGIKSQLTVKKLASKVTEEEEKITALVDFLKEKKAEGYFDYQGEELGMEELSLLNSNLAVTACEEEFEELDPGLAFYVADRYYSEIFEETQEEADPEDCESTSEDTEKGQDED